MAEHAELAAVMAWLYVATWDAHSSTSSVRWKECGDRSGTPVSISGVSES